MFTVTLKLDQVSTNVLEVILRNSGYVHKFRGDLLRAGILLDMANQVSDQLERPPEVALPFPGSETLNYTRLLNGLIRELSGRTLASDEHNHWSRVLRATADRLDQLHQEVSDGNG